MMIKKIIISIQKNVLLLICLLLPVFFLPFTQEFFNTGKFYFFTISLCLIIGLYGLRLLYEKRISYYPSPLHKPLLFFISSFALSLLFVTPNKIQALFALPSGFILIVAMCLFSIILIQKLQTEKDIFRYITIMFFPVITLCILLFAHYFHVFNMIHLPIWLQFINKPQYSLLGNSIELIVVLGFFSVYAITKVIITFLENKKTPQRFVSLLPLSFILIIVLSALAISVKTTIDTQNNTNVQMAPVTESWNATIETLKSPKTALFGVGIDNYLSLFTKIKPVSYNLTPIWNLNFNLSRSAFLHIWSEVGLLGIGTFLFLFYTLFRELKWINKQNVPERLILNSLFIYIFLVFLFFPPMIHGYFLFFSLCAIIIAASLKKKNATSSSDQGIRSIQMIAKPLDTLYVCIGLLIIVIATMGIYFLSRVYNSEYIMNKGVKATTNNVSKAYEYELQSIRLNPYQETSHRTFSQLNLLIAHNIMQKKNISSQDRQRITFFLQNAVNEAKTATTLNPQNVINWNNLAVLYGQLVNVVTEAGDWTVSAYQEAVLRDPNNPILQLNLGGTYYSLGNYDESTRIFTETVNIKPDFANAYYNLAWSLFQEKKYEKAIAAMEQVRLLVKKNTQDYTVVIKDLKTFSTANKKIAKPTTDKNKTGEQPSAQQNLNLPVSPEAKLSPPVVLPDSLKNASSEAKPTNKPPIR